MPDDTAPADGSPQSAPAQSAPAASPQPYAGADGTPPPASARPYGHPDDVPYEPAPPTYAPSPQGQPPYAATPPGQPPYAQPPYAQAPYAQPPYGAPPPTQPPYGQPPYAHPPYGQPQYPVTGPPPQPPAPPASPETIAAVRRLNRRALMYAVSGFVLGFLLLGLGVFFVPLALVVDIGALVLASRARRAAREAGQSDAGGIIAIITASLGVAFVISVLAMVAVFWNELHAYNECMAGANTVQARETCQQDLSDAIMRRLGV